MRSLVTGDGAPSQRGNCNGRYNAHHDHQCVKLRAKSALRRVLRVEKYCHFLRRSHFCKSATQSPRAGLCTVAGKVLSVYDVQILHVTLEVVGAVASANRSQVLTRHSTARREPAFRAEEVYGRQQPREHEKAQAACEKSAEQRQSETSHDFYASNGPCRVVVTRGRRALPRSSQTCQQVLGSGFRSGEGLRAVSALAAVPTFRPFRRRSAALSRWKFSELPV